MPPEFSSHLTLLQSDTTDQLLSKGSHVCSQGNAAVLGYVSSGPVAEVQGTQSLLLTVTSFDSTDSLPRTR